jgi:two-component system sensor histidine kinase DegS
MSSRSKGDWIGLSRRYFAALRKQLTLKPGASLRAAESLGREALAVGLDTLDLVRTHKAALITLLPAGPSSRNSDGVVKRTASFLDTALTPIENAHRTALKNNGRVNRLYVTMRRRTAELAATHRQLRRELVRSETAQKALKKSEQHYGQLLERSRHMQEHSRRLSREILSAQEEERKKISRELHDAIGQALTAINIKLATLRKKATHKTTGLATEIASTQRLVERSMNTVHRFARELRPPMLDDQGLIPALDFYINDFTKRTRIPVVLTAVVAVEQLGSDKRTVLYRVTQEALTNVVKHAEASLVEVSIQKLQGVVRMEIHDNGKSFQVQRVLDAKRIRRLGLLGMRERVEMVGGSFSVESAPAKGTTIRAQIPFGDGH